MRTSILRKARICAAAAVFTLVLLAFLDFREAFPAATAIARAQLVPSLLRALGGAGAAAFAAWLLVTLLFGRIYCSSACPLGVFQDVVWRLRQRIAPARLRHAPAHNRIRAAIAIGTVACGAAGLWVVPSLLDPYSLFGRVATVLFRPALLAANNLLVGFAGTSGGLYRVDLPPWHAASLAVAAGSLCLVTFLAAGRGRLFCNTVCPVGGLLGLLSSRAVVRLRIDKSVCGKCGDCLASCKAQCIDLKSQEIDFSRCVACYDCVQVCDRQGISYRTAPAPAGRDAPADPGLRKTLSRLAAAAAVLWPARVLARHERADDEERGNHGEHRSRRPILPPGALSLERFLDRCTACGLCISNCPTRALQPAFLEYGWSGFLKPRLDPSAGYCNFDCTICSTICPTGALSPLTAETKRRTQCGEARFHKRHCIVYTDGTDCAACSEHCPTKAVDTRPFHGDLLLPEVNEDLCIGCGACEFACPVRPERAIRVEGRGLQVTLAPRPAPAAPAAGTREDDFPF